MVKKQKTSSKNFHKKVLHKETKTILLATVFALLIITIGVFSIQVFREKEVVGQAYHIVLGPGGTTSSYSQIFLNDFPYPFVEDLAALVAPLVTNFNPDVFNSFIVIHSNNDIGAANKLSSAIEQRILFCADKDQGRDYYTGSFITTYVMPGIFSDHCESGPFGDILTEYFCVGGVPYYENVVCEQGCAPDMKSCKVPEPASGYKVFVTDSNQMYNGELDGLLGADDKCRLSANNAGLHGVYKAWLSTTAESASDRLYHSNVPYVLVNGTRVANNWDDLTDGNLLHSINVNQFGARLPDYFNVWTGTDIEGKYPMGGLAGTIVLDPNFVSCKMWDSTSSTVVGQYTVGQTGQIGLH